MRSASPYRRLDVRFLPRLAALAWLSAISWSGPLLAASDRPPLVLDSQTGIHDGRSGFMLQNAPLVREPMVQAQPAAAAAEFAPQGQPPIVVSPYIELPSGGAAQTSVPRLRSPRQ